MKKYQVDKIKFGFKYNYDSYFSSNIENYEIESNAIVDHVIEVVIKDNIKLPEGKTNSTKNPYIIIKDNERIVYAKGKNNIRLKLTNDLSFNKMLIELNKNEITNLAMTEYIFSGIMFLDLAQYLSYLPLHATAIKKGDDVILFSAPSGTGKSTHRKYWSEIYKDIAIINDDKPLLSFNNNNIEVIGSPFSGEERINKNTKGNLKAIVFLKQGTNNKIRVLSKEESIQELIRNTVTPKQDLLWDTVLKQIEKIIDLVPIIELSATNDQSAVRAVYKYLYEGDFNNEN